MFSFQLFSKFGRWFVFCSVVSSSSVWGVFVEYSCYDVRHDSPAFRRGLQQEDGSSISRRWFYPLRRPAKLINAVFYMDYASPVASLSWHVLVSKRGFNCLVVSVWGLFWVRCGQWLWTSSSHESQNSHAMQLHHMIATSKHSSTVGLCECFESRERSTFGVIVCTSL